MITIDRRTRPDTVADPLDPDTFVDERLPDVLRANGDLAGRAVTRLGLPPLTLDVDGTPVTFGAGPSGLSVDRAMGDGLVLRLDRQAFSDLVNDVASIFGVQMTGRATVVAGEPEALLDWEPVLRCLLDGRPVYEPGTIASLDRDGAPLDLQRSFTLDDDPEEIGHFLSRGGFPAPGGRLRRGRDGGRVGRPRQGDRRRRPDDGASWWARTEQGDSYPARVLGFNQRSPALRELLRERAVPIDWARSPTTSSCSAIQTRATRRRACSRGSASSRASPTWAGTRTARWVVTAASAAASSVGISVTGAARENGELGVVAGSHRANVPVLGVDGLDLPPSPLPTRTGDITVHCSCTLHMSRPPVSAERRVVYTGFGLAPRPGDVAVASSTGRPDRAALNDHVRRHQAGGGADGRGGSFEL